MFLHKKIVSLALVLFGINLSAHAQEAANPYNYSRSFEYNPQGQVSAEIIEPNNPQLCVRTEHTYNTSPFKV